MFVMVGRRCVGSGAGWGPGLVCSELTGLLSTAVCSDILTDELLPANIKRGFSLFVWCRHHWDTAYVARQDGEASLSDKRFTNLDSRCYVY